MSENRETEWTKCSNKRPPNHAGKFRFRITADILGIVMAPEWTADMQSCGMGYGDNEWWPEGLHHWNGARRYFTADFEWRELTSSEADADEKNIVWNGLDLADCPFTGRQPVVDYYGRWIGAPPNKAEWLSIKSHMVDSIGWRDAVRMRTAWNARPDQMTLTS